MSEPHANPGRLIKAPEGFLSREGNRHGMSTEHSLWPGRGLRRAGGVDVKAVACMKDCRAMPVVLSRLPESARRSHGNLAEQNRLVGAQRGAQTPPPAGATAQPAQTLPAPDAQAIAKWLADGAPK